MNKPTVLGKYIYIEIPQQPEYKIQVDANTKEELQKAWVKKLKRLKVWAVGEGANPSIKEGCEVLVDPAYIKEIKMVPFDEDEEKVYGLVVDYMIVHIW